MEEDVLNCLLGKCSKAQENSTNETHKGIIISRRHVKIAKDEVKEKQEKEEEKKVEEKKTTWFHKVPPIFKLVGIGLIFVKYQAIASAGGKLGELWIWIIGVFMAWYFLGIEGKKIEEKVLTPKEAFDALKKEIKQRITQGRISRWAKINITENDNLFHNEAMPRHYEMGVEIMENNLRKYKRGIVFAIGDTKGYATLQDYSGSFRGTETPPIARPKWMDEIKKYDLDIGDFLWGKGRK